MNEAFYNSLASELQGKLRRLSAFVTHAPTVGAFHEEVLRSVLRTMLPDRFSLRTGFGYDQIHGPSAQGDILVIDESRAGAYYYREGDFAVVSRSAVVCVIEVKTVLTKSTFLRGISNLASFRRKTVPFHDPATFLFAFESRPFTQAVLGSWYAAATLPDDLRNYPWAVFALDRGILHLHKGASGRYGHHFIFGEDAPGPKLKALSFFLQQFRKALLMYDGDTTNPFKDALFDDLWIVREALHFGVGVVK